MCGRFKADFYVFKARADVECASNKWAIQVETDAGKEPHTSLKSRPQNFTHSRGFQAAGQGHIVDFGDLDLGAWETVTCTSRNWRSMSSSSAARATALRGARRKLHSHTQFAAIPRLAIWAHCRPPQPPPSPILAVYY